MARPYNAKTPRSDIDLSPLHTAVAGQVATFVRGGATRRERFAARFTPGVLPARRAALYDRIEVATAEWGQELAWRVNTPEEAAPSLGRVAETRLANAHTLVAMHSGASRRYPQAASRLEDLDRPCLGSQRSTARTARCGNPGANKKR